MKHRDVCAHIDGSNEERDILIRENFDVCMRLFHSSPQYKKLVVESANYILRSMQETKEGYSTPLGWSGANAGIPWRIIAVTLDGAPTIMINPLVFVEKVKGAKTEKVLSNCGSLTLPLKIPVWRWKRITVRYFDMDGQPQTRTGLTRVEGGYTIQHECDHTFGILITDERRRI